MDVHGWTSLMKLKRFHRMKATFLDNEQLARCAVRDNRSSTSLLYCCFGFELTREDGTRHVNGRPSVGPTDQSLAFLIPTSHQAACYIKFCNAQTCSCTRRGFADHSRRKSCREMGTKRHRCKRVYCEFSAVHRRNENEPWIGRRNSFGRRGTQTLVAIAHDLHRSQILFLA